LKYKLSAEKMVQSLQLIDVNLVGQTSKKK